MRTDIEGHVGRAPITFKDVGRRVDRDSGAQDSAQDVRQPLHVSPIQPRDHCSPRARSGACRWDEPRGPGVRVSRAANQWWELLVSHFRRLPPPPDSLPVSSGPDFRPLLLLLRARLADGVAPPQRRRGRRSVGQTSGHSPATADDARRRQWGRPARRHSGQQERRRSDRTATGVALNADLFGRKRPIGLRAELVPQPEPQVSPERAFNCF